MKFPVEKLGLQTPKKKGRRFVCSCFGVARSDVTLQLGFLLTFFFTHLTPLKLVKQKFVEIT